MKKLLVIAALATSAGAAQAATSKSTAKNAKATASSTTTKPVAVTDDATSAQPVKASPVSAAVGNSTLTTTAEDKAKAGQTWSASFVTLIETGAADLNYANAEDHSVKTTNYMGLGYKLNATNTFGFRQYFTAEHAFDEKAGTSKNKTTLNDSVLTYSRKMGKIAGSEAITPQFWYYAPTSEASQALNSYGKLRLDAEADWNLTPKWAVGYYFNPRQSFMPDSVTVDPTGKATENFSRTTLIHYGLLYYNASDMVQLYTYAGFNHSWRTSRATLADETRLAAVGANFTFFKGGLIINPEVYSEMQTVKDSIDVADNVGIADSNVTYALTAAVTF